MIRGRIKKMKVKIPSAFDVSYYVTSRTCKGARALVLGTVGFAKGIVKGTVDGARGTTDIGIQDILKEMSEEKEKVVL